MFSFLRSRIAVATLAGLAALSLTACNKNTASAEQDSSITATTPVSGEASTLTERNELQRLQQALQQNFQKAGVNVSIKEIRNTSIPNMYWVTLNNGSPVLASADAKFIFQGEAYELGGTQLKNLTANLQAVDNKAKFAALNPKDLIIYPAKGKAKHVVYVFTDVSCPYCNRLHSHMSEINALGIEVRYVAWPRGEQFFPAMQAIWCSEDRKAAIEKGFKHEDLPPAPANCKSPVQAQYDLGLSIGVSGTPAIYNQDGHHIGAYMPAKDLLEALEQQAK